MRILFFSNPLRRRLLPLLPLARALRRQGHEVAFSTAAETASWLEAEGFALIHAGPVSHEVTAETARRLGTDILFRATADLVAVLAGVRVDLLADEALDRARQWVPDLVVAEHTDLVGPLVASALDLPCAVAVAGPALEPAELDALAAAAGPHYLRRGLRPPSRVPSGRWLLDLCPPSLQRVGWHSFPGRIPMRAEAHLGWAPSVRESGVRGSGRRAVLVGFGAEAGTSLELGPVMRSLSTLDVDLVVATRKEAADGLAREPDGTRLSSDCPAAEQLLAASAVLHHGGPDITFAAVARGTPAVVVPESPEQEQQAALLAAAGAGIALPPREQDPAVITAALRRVLSEASFTAAASRIRDEIAAMPTAPQVARRLVAAVTAERGR